MEKTINNGDPQPVTNTGNTVIEIVVPFSFSGKEPDSVTVYRYHDAKAEPLDKKDTKGGGTFRLDADNGLIHIYATKFSTYATGYTPTGGGGGGGGGGGNDGGGGGYDPGLRHRYWTQVRSGKRHETR